jgi:hypothetical protein
MKRLRILIPLALTGALLAYVLTRSPGQLKRFATPTECLESYREALIAGDVPRYLGCLDEPLRAEKKRSATANALRRQMRGVKSWTQLEPVSRGPQVYIDVDTIQVTEAHRTRYHFRRTESGWLITAIEPSKSRKAGIPYGTPVEDVSEGP